MTQYSVGEAIIVDNSTSLRSFSKLSPSNQGSIDLEPSPLSITLKKSQLISRPLPADAGLSFQSGGQVLDAEVRWEINTVFAELTMLFFGDSSKQRSPSRSILQTATFQVIAP